MGITDTFSPHVRRKDISTDDLEVLHTVASEMNYPLEDLVAAYKYESTYGSDERMNEGTYQGPFQFSESLADSLNIDRYDLYSSAKGYVMNLLPARESLIANLKHTSGDTSFVDEIDPSLLNYLLHQQGGKGVARMALAHYSGDTGKQGSQWYMNKIEGTLLQNLSREQQKEMRRLATPRDKVEYFMKKTQENLEGGNNAKE